LLNVAVGGNWPGNPDATTVFPQTMEVDYVRVFDDFFPYLTGNRKVPNQANNVSYQIHNASANATIEWTIPAGATIVSGQGTANLIVDWGTSGGAIEVSIADECNTESISLDVEVESAFAAEFSFENFDNPGRVNLEFVSGDFEDEVANPAPNEVNSSNLVGKYTRNSSAQFDVFVYGISDLGNSAVYLNNEKKFYIDIYTSAPVGTSILLQLENSNLATPPNFPTGRHSRFEVITTVQNEWERLEFQFLDQPDANVPDASITQFIILFAPNTTTNDVYHFDNFDSYAISTTVSTKDLAKRETSLVKVAPNPMNEYMILQNISKELINQIQIVDLNGSIVHQEWITLFPNQKQDINTASLSSGIYILSALSENGYQQNQQIVVIRD